MEHDKDINDLLFKYFAGEASPEEAMLVNEWHSHSVNKKEYEEALRIWNLMPGTNLPSPPSLAKSWKEVKLVLPAKKIHLPRYFAAAAVLGIVMLGILWWSNQQSPQLRSTVSQQVHAISSGDSSSQVNLPDGTNLTLSRLASVTYTDSFDQVKRSILLTGECYFNVAHDTKRPFLISIENLTIQVVGTSFNVRPISNFVEVQVTAGTVKLVSPKMELLVRNGETGMYDTLSKMITLQHGIDVNSLGYATKNFQFNDLPFLEACAYVEKSFDVMIEVDKEIFRNCRITSKFQNKTLDYILDVLTATVDATYARYKGKIIIKGKGCE